MKLALFGGTGTAGTALLKQALDAGHDVQVLARTPAKISQADHALRVIAGDAKDPAAVAATLSGCDAVLTALGGLADSDSIRVGTALITSAMHEAGIQRLVIVQGFHLDFPGDPHNLGRKTILPLLWLGSRTLIRDSRAMASAIQASDLDWTVIRAPRITRGGPTGNARVGQLKLGPFNSVTNGDIAELALRSLTPDTIEAILARTAARPDSPLILVEIRHLGGAIARRPDVPSAVPGRDAAFSLFTMAPDLPPPAQAAPAAVAGLIAAVTPWRSASALPNFLGRRTDPELVVAAWPADDRERLLTIKQWWDPANLFRLGHVIVQPPIAR